MHHPVRTGETNKKRNLKIYPTKVRHVSLIAQAVSQLKPNSEPPAAAILS